MTDDLVVTDVLIIGCGIAGCTTALTLADAGVAVTMVTRARQPEDSNTLWAQGGIIYQGRADSPAQLAEDILNAGAGYSYPPAVEILTEEGPGAVERILIERAGVPFDHDADGQLSLGLEGGHRQPRIIHAADATGRAIEIALLNQVAQHPNIDLRTDHTAIDLLTPSHNARNRLAVYTRRSTVGAYVLERATGRVLRIMAKKTVLASGGLGRIFLRTTNPAGARGDGIAMAYRTGVRIINAEFVQFHPTAFFRRNETRFLISEAVRGAGARLVNAAGETFMDRYAPEWKDLAPRDVVARSIHREMLANDVANVYLDLHSYIPADEIKSRFPTIYADCLKFGVDITREPAPVVPAAHYFCGGIWTDLWGQTNRTNLYAVGEVACTGVHGGNRLASTSLLEGLVWGERAARHMLDTLPETPLHDPADMPGWEYSGAEVADPALVSQDMSAIQNIMWNYVGLVRTRARLERALRDLRQLNLEIEHFYRRVPPSDELIGLRNAARAAIIVADAAWQNKQSVGCHYRED